MISEKVGVRPAPSPGIIGKRARGILSVRDPSVELFLGGLNLDGIKLDDLRAWCKEMLSSRNRWDIGRRRYGIGLFGSRMLKRDEAERVFSMAFAASVGGAG